MIQREDLQMWDEVIQMIDANKSSTPAQQEELLRKLAKKFELNKRELEKKINIILTYANRQAL